MANSRAIVGSDSGAIPEIVRHGENGVLFPPGDAEALAEAILELVQSPEVRVEMGEQGRRLFYEKFYLDREVADTEELYRSLLARRL
jgi:glycosyltransferase involved in cell wall biosynthesis